VAPYAPGEPPAHLGAAKKIELVAGLLRRLGFAVHLVDSSHHDVGFRAPIYGARRRVDGHDVTLWRPFCLPSRKAGKLSNIYLSSGLFARLSALDPQLVWLYNSYAFEARLGLHLQRRTACRVVLELEDLPRARDRGLNPKPLLDALYFDALLARAELVTFVNASLQRDLAARTAGRTALFPSILRRDLATGRPRERFVSSPCVVGYFGGLEREKGVGVLLDSLELLPHGWRMLVTGAGSYESALREAQARLPAKLEFHGRVSHERMAELMQTCDAIVNPHASIAAASDGLFPFKVCEALASGALLISTPLPSIDIDLSAAVRFFDGSVAGLVEALLNAESHYREHREAIAGARDAVRGRYSEDAQLRALGPTIETLFSEGGDLVAGSSRLEGSAGNV
jgi:glycosyltransferase involved in cell wall biosynthesis